MLADAADIVRLSLHVTAAAVWVGGQATLAGLVPALRREGPTAVAPAARQFARLAWPAYAALVATGVWNIIAVHPSSQGSAWKVVLAVKIIVVLTSGGTAWLHQRTTTTRGRAVWGALTSQSALSALVLALPSPAEPLIGLTTTGHHSEQPSAKRQDVHRGQDGWVTLTATSYSPAFNTTLDTPRRRYGLGAEVLFAPLDDVYGRLALCRSST